MNSTSIVIVVAAVASLMMAGLLLWWIWSRDETEPAPARDPYDGLPAKPSVLSTKGYDKDQKVLVQTVIQPWVNYAFSTKSTCWGVNDFVRVQFPNLVQQLLDSLVKVDKARKQGGTELRLAQAERDFVSKRMQTAVEQALSACKDSDTISNPAATLPWFGKVQAKTVTVAEARKNSIRI